MKHHSLAVLLLSSGLLSIGLVSPALAQGDAETIDRIIQEGRDHSQVWDHLTYLSESIGTRLTGSTGALRANAWTRDRFAEMGLDAHLQKWGEIAVGFDRGISRARMVEPVEHEFEFTARSWSAGTDGPVRGHVVKEPASIGELEAMRDQLAGAWVLGKGRARGGRRRGVVPEGDTPDIREEIGRLLREAGIAGQLIASRSDLVRTGSVRGWRELEYGSLLTDVTVYVRRADYDAMNSRLADGEQLVVEVDLDHHFFEGPLPVYNTVAEIRGTERPEEVVIVSAHLDSWDGPGSQGTQDNGTGSAVTLEAARILSAVGVKPKRTIRFILWTGEEQGLLGSRGYLETLSEEERAGISAVFVDDGGTNYQGGLVCVESMVPMLAAATAPINEAFPDMQVEIASREKMPRGGGSDHASFNRAGIPGFFWMEKGSGGMEGKTYRFIHHTQHDTMRYPVKEYLVQAATCSAVTAYNLAMAETLLPRYVPVEETPAEPESGTTEQIAFTVASGPLSGTWKAALNDDPDRAFTMIFEMSDDGRVRGRVESQIGNGPIRKPLFDPETQTLTFLRDTEMGTFSFEVTVEGETLTGTLSVEDQFTAPFKATRQPAEPAAAAEEKKGEVAADDAVTQEAGVGSGAG